MSSCSKRSSKKLNIDLIDFKIEFGTLTDGQHRSC